MEQKEEVKKKKVSFNCERASYKKLKTFEIKKTNFANKEGVIRRPKRSLSTKLPVNFVPRLHPKKSKIKASPLKLNKTKSSKLGKSNCYILDRQLSDEEASCFNVSSDSSSSSSDLFLQKKINNTKIKSTLINEIPNNENQEKKEDGKKLSSLKLYSQINNPIKEYENEDLDFSDEENFKNNEGVNQNKDQDQNKNQNQNQNKLSPSNEKNNLDDKDIYSSLRFSSEVSNFKLEEYKNNEDKNISVKPFNEEDQDCLKYDSIKALRKRMTHVRTKTTKEKLKETAEIIHSNMIKNYDMELTNDNLDKIDNNNIKHYMRKKTTIISNSANLQEEDAPKRKKSMSILEMLSFSQKGKK